MNHPPGQAPPPKRVPTWIIVVICLGAAAVVVIPIFSVVAVYGVRKYLANAKTAEARNALGQIARDAASAYARDRALCPSASSPIPADMKMISGARYQSVPAEWQADRARNAGFGCLGFSLEQPQYFQYSYVASKTGFTAIARGDLDGDGQFSTFLARGRIEGGVLQIGPSVEETSPEE